MGKTLTYMMLNNVIISESGKIEGIKKEKIDREKDQFP